MGRSGIVTIMCCCIIIIYSYSDNGCSCRRESGRLEGWKIGSPSGYGAKAAKLDMDYSPQFKWHTDLWPPSIEVIA